ncbi:hypothetical protein EI94DRAFT_1817810 [Lactarius quietus]|nr:hypothetical protein EI94DRAFT_1817810 [Lactarius quietus]
MPSETRASILDAALTCLGERISTIQSILHQPGDKDKNYIPSLHNEVLAAVWIVGLLPSDGSSPVPESVQDAFHSFLDIRNPGSYTATDGRQLPKGDIHKLDAPHFNFTEWWKIGEGDTMGEPFDVRDELVEGLLHVLEMQEAGAQLREKIMEAFKKAWEIYAETDSQVKSLGDVLRDGIDSLEHYGTILEDS